MAGRTLSVEPQVFDLLVYLIEHRSRVVSKEELLDNIWGNRFVSESTLTSRVKSARRAIGDDGQSQRCIRTVQGRGYQFVARVEETGAGSNAVPAAIPPADASELGVAATRLIGRRQELSDLADLMGRVRLLTLTGPGGVGKTRLAAELATRIGDRFADGVRFVALTRVRDPALVASLVVETLVPRSDGSGAPELLLREWLRGRTILLVLDNFEHVADAAPLVSDLLRSSLGLSVITTSRERLRLAGEQVYEVMPLDTNVAADDDVDRRLPDALALFEQSARAVDPSFVIDEKNRDDVAAICRSLDGLPLALELAGPRIRTLPTRFLRDRLARRIDALSEGMRNHPERHQTIRAAITWSYDLLAPSERRLFNRLAVFAAPASLEAIEDVCGVEHDVDIFSDLASLVDKSLVRRVDRPAGDPRFTMLELLHEFASEEFEAAAERDEIRRRHALHFAELVATYEEARWGDAAGYWIDAIHAQMADIRAAFDWSSAAGEHRTAGRIAASLYGYLDVHPEPVARWTKLALTWIDEFEPLSVGELHLAAGYLEYIQGRTDATRHHWLQALAAFRDFERPRYVALGLAFVAGTYTGRTADYGHALGLCSEAIDLARETGEQQTLAHILNIKGELARLHGDDDLAATAYQAALDATRAGGDRGTESAILANLAYLARHRGAYDEAQSLGRQSLRMCWTLGLRMMAAWRVSELAGAELGLGAPDRAARLVGASDAALEIMGVARGPGDQPEHDDVMHELERVLGADRLAEFRAEGAAMTLEECVGYALDEAVDREP
ncbi:MAG TPA: winged helix-turn-helix domain-containing protein [Jiangellaceae bacterium]|nr:winged helix-turn-helix domain-containing protein [Jiangellaceae bacterium]